MIAVEVTDANDLPVQVHLPQRALGQNRGPIHQVDVVLPRSKVPPQDVRLAIPIHVAGSSDAPIQIANTADVAFGGFDRERVYRPKIVLARRRLSFADELSSGVIVKDAIAQAVGLPDSLAERIHLV